jgi:hypothetical protein
VRASLVLDGTCLKDPGASWGLSSALLLLPEKQEAAMQMALGLPAGISPPPRCGRNGRVFFFLAPRITDRLLKLELRAKKVGRLGGGGKTGVITWIR